MSGVDTVRGINYQHCHAILTALDVAGDDSLVGIRVEGTVDALDLEVLAEGPDGAKPILVRGLQMKSRQQPYTWARSELLSIVRHWAELPISEECEFVFLTDGDLSPSGKTVALAFDEARNGSNKSIANLLGLRIDDPMCFVMARVRVISEPGSVEALLLTAEVEIQSLLDLGPNHPDASREAAARLNALFRLVSTRSGQSAASARFISRREIVATLGGVSGVAESDRWNSSLKQEYLREVSLEDMQGLVAPILDASWTDKPLQLHELAFINSPMLIAGRTGSGKSTLARLWRHSAATDGAVVIVCHAEAYLAQRLDRLVIDSVGAAVDRTLPRLIGRQVLADPNVTVILDGVSETPQDVRHSLAAELRRHLAWGYGARVITMGRDESACAAVFPMSQAVQRLYSRAFGPSQQLALTAKVLNEPLSDFTTDAQPATRMEISVSVESSRIEAEGAARRCREALARVEYALGDAVGNPMLLTLALQLVSSGVPFTDRASVYELTIARMADRANAGDIRICVAVLGIIFAELLDGGRRYANPLEWARLLAQAAATLRETGVATDIAAIHDSVSRSGLISAVVTGIGRTTLRVPVHDSFADYFAARAHADGLVLLPPHLLENDINRLLLSSQMRMLTETEVLVIAQQLPFSLVRISESDHLPMNRQSPNFIASLLRTVLPNTTHVSVTMWRSGTGKTVAQVGLTSTGWVDVGNAPSVYDGPTVVAEKNEGPTAVAVRLWQLLLKQCLRSTRRVLMRTPRSTREACDQLIAHCYAASAAVTDIIEQVSPSAALDRLRETVGPLGMTGAVYERDAGGALRQGWPVTYRPTEEVDLAVGYGSLPAREEMTVRYCAWSDVESRVATSPEATAAKAVSDAIARLTRAHWP